MNVDVEVQDRDGRWSATFFTLLNLQTLLDGYRRSGECASGTYLWATDMIVVRELNAQVIIKSVLDLRSTGEFEKAFQRLVDDDDDEDPPRGMTD